MMKKIALLWFLALFFFIKSIAQNVSSNQIINSDSLDEWWVKGNTERLTEVLKNNLADSVRLGLLKSISVTYSETNIDSALKYGKLCYFLSRKIKWANEEAWSLDFVGAMYLRTGNATLALQLCLQALKMFEHINDSTWRTINYKNLGDAFNSQKDPKAFNYYFKSLKWAMKNPEGNMFKTWTLNSLGSAYLNKNMPDSANYYAQQSYQLNQSMLKIKGMNLKYYSDCLNLLGRIRQISGNKSEALEYFRAAIGQAYATSNFNSVSENYMSLSLIFREANSEDSSLIYAMKAYAIADHLNNPYLIMRISNFLKEYYKGKNKLDSAFKYEEINSAEKDNLLNSEKIRQVQNLAFDEQLRQQEILAQQLQYRNKIRTYAVLTIAIILLGMVFILWRNNRHKQKLNTILQEQKEEIQSTLTELKSTQSQLIQAEKMASLGELTAGIAHEIQNPLNFVNNFSEVNKELVDEMQQEMNKGNLENAKAISNDIRDNQEKINQHGKRADAIVKGMLQHSQTSKGQKEPTNINKLSDEYLRLSYNGFRAKDKTFNATLKTDFDESIGKMNIIPQDIGRVLLNLYNNSFYEVNERSKKQLAGYEPTVSISTKQVNGKVELCVKDNGNGISQKVVDKIFQPFFTTKPTGQGTGLGLSLAYDIVKTHGGRLKVETREGEGASFIMELPLA